MCVLKFCNAPNSRFQPVAMISTYTQSQKRNSRSHNIAAVAWNWFVISDILHVWNIYNLIFQVLLIVYVLNCNKNMIFFPQMSAQMWRFQSRYLQHFHILEGAFVTHITWAWLHCWQMKLHHSFDIPGICISWYTQIPCFLTQYFVSPYPCLLKCSLKTK